MKALQRILVLVLAVVVLLASNGVVLAIHTCFTSKTTAVSLFHHGKCDSEKKKSASRRADCCSGKKKNASSSRLAASCCVETIDYKKSDINALAVNADALLSVVVCPPVVSAIAVPIVNLNFNTYSSGNKAPPWNASNPDFIFAAGSLLI